MTQPPRPVCDLVDARDDHSCVRCGRSLFVETGSRHHRKLRSQGGKHDVSNLILLCGSGTTGCHGWVHANPAEALRGGWYARSWQDTLGVPVKHYKHGWVLLDDAGGFVAVPPPACDLEAA